MALAVTALRLPALEITLADYSADFSRMLVKDVLLTRRFMNDEDLGKLLEKMSYFYCSIPVTAVRQIIMEQYPEVTPEQFDAVLKRCQKDPEWQHYCVVESRLAKEPELTSHRAISDEDLYKQFLAARRDGLMLHVPRNILA